MVDNDESKILFLPAQFLNQDPNPIKQTYKLEDSVLMYWAVEGTQIRSRFRDKAEKYGRYKDEGSPKVTKNVRTRLGLTLSVASRDPLGQSDTFIRNQMKLETVPS